MKNDSSDVKIISFDPIFLNINMNLSIIRNSEYNNLCEQHAFFQLSPFLTSDVNKMGFNLSQDSLEKMDFLFNMLKNHLDNQEDWYWSCRARSYFIEIISILERIFYDFYLESNCKAAIPENFINILTFINNHLGESHTLDSIYEKFYINKNEIENLFKQHLNMTFYEYLRKRRFEEASYYLRFTELEGECIAFRIGLSSSQNFCKIFKKMCGQTPNEFRKEAIEKRRKDKILLKIPEQTSMSS